jgi:acetolactate synthase I/II/III large subunit
VNDGAYGNVRRIQAESFGNRLIGSDLRNPDFQRFVESFGALALRARDAAELRPALRTAFKAEVPAVVEIPAGSMPDPWPILRQPPSRMI